MPLVHLELENFKSYRGKKVIGPFYDFTCVIGPNGSGKSNLMDAISFVLGVKSAQLRSSQLKDLIYRGRKLGAGGAAEGGEEGEGEGRGEGEGTATTASVTAVYKDGSGKEWRFQRTISASGSSEYRLNGRAVAYAKYNSTLEQHNILIKAKNFLVFQGDVEAIASQSPKDLTRLIEQISGSLELKEDYERAKLAQERAVENSTFSFSKRRGINSELKQFREQKTEAEKFERLQRDKERAILLHLLWRLFHINDGISSNTGRINAKNDELAGLRAEVNRQERHLREARKEQAQAHKETMRKEKDIKRKEKDLEDKRPELVAVDEKIAHSVRKSNNAETLHERVQKDEERQARSLQQLRAELDQVRRAADRADAAARQAAESGMALSEADRNEYREKKAEASLRATAERQQLETLYRERKTKDSTLASLKDKLEELNRRKSKLAAEQETLNERNLSLQTRIKETQDGLAKAKQNLNGAQAERTRISQIETELNEKLQDCYNKLLQARVDQKESERESKLKEIFASLQKIFPGVQGRVIDLCKPTQRKYEAAVATVLGRNADAVIVDREKTAIDCIEYMRSSRAGQATFIPLDTIQVKGVNEKYRSIARGARLAIDVIQYDPGVERALQHACGNALICDSLDVARYVCYEKGQEVKAVTLEGTVIHKSGLITGGQSGGGPGRRWEDREVQSLHRLRDNCLAQLQELSKTKPRGNIDEDFMSEISRLESELTVAKDDLSATQRRLNGIKDEIKQVDKEINALTPRHDDAVSEVDKLAGRISKLESVVNAEEDEIFIDFCRRIGVSNVRQFEERQLKVTQEQSEARLQFDTQIARLTHQVNFEQEQLSTTRERLQLLRRTVNSEKESLKRLETERTRIQAELDAIKTDTNNLHEELAQLTEEHNTKTSALEEVKRSTYKAMKRLDGALKEIAAWNDEIEKFDSERSALYKRCRLEEIDLPLVSGDLSRVPLEEVLHTAPMNVDGEDDATQRAIQVQDFGIEVDFTDLEDDEKANGSSDMDKELQSNIAKIAAEIEKLAPNMKAIDRLEDVESKLAETEKDFDRARREAKSAKDEFNDIKKRRCDLFNKAYSHISERIDKVYKELTKGKASPMGGVAYLTVEDSEEPYLGGIKYHAMPPMKRFRDMEQLSGGEKTMAALALLFAIHSFQPAPFFVLDEVDAALDNTNVGKIANYIKQHADQSFQFIVISLKSSLYERAQALVGIYRDQGYNSSSTLTLDLTKFAAE